MAIETPSNTFLVMDLLSGGDLFYQLDKTLANGSEGFAEDKARVILAEISLGLVHLHRCGYLHLDIKIENVMVDARGHIKIVDFGLAQEVPATLEMEMKPRGSLLYMAPELLRLNVAGRFTDWWAMGVLAHELFTARSPWSTITDVHQIRTDIRSLPIRAPTSLSSEAGDFVVDLLVRNHLERLGTRSDEEVLAAPFFAGIDWEAMKRGETTPALTPIEGEVAVDPRDASDALKKYQRNFLADFNANMELRERLSSSSGAVGEPWQ
jgi:p70 ribosomal S6 kinase